MILQLLPISLLAASQSLAFDHTGKAACSKTPSHTTIGVEPLSLCGSARYGLAIRSDDVDPELIAPGNATALGLKSTGLGGINQDDGNVNYGRGDRVSEVFQLSATLDLDFQGIGAFVRMNAWQDMAAKRDDVHSGNVPNGYQANRPLSDRGFSTRAKFSGVEASDAYVYGSFDFEHPILVQVGFQTVPWGMPATIHGGLEALNPLDHSAYVRPGGLPEEMRIPVPGIFGRMTLSPNFTGEFFYQFSFRPNSLPGCGTFASYSDYAADGCDKVLLTSARTDAQNVAAGLFAKRSSDLEPPDRGQFGIGMSALLQNVGKLGAYVASYHSRRQVVSAIKSSNPGGVPLIPADPFGGNVQYLIEYPPDIRLFALTFATMTERAKLFAEYTYRPNQPVSVSATDLFNAFASNTAATQLRRDAEMTPNGGVYHGFDRLKVSQLSLGGAFTPGQVLGGESTLSGEFGLRLIHDLPDVDNRRYGRGDPWGIGPVLGACSGTSKQCTSSGYATRSSWGYRLRLQNHYRSVFDGIDLIPSISFGHDVNGWSYDGILSEGRQFALVSLRADLGKQYFVETRWNPVWGGDYNLTKDRDSLSFVVGANF